MELVRIEDVKEVTVLSPRQGELRSRPIVRGEEGTPGNFSFELNTTDLDRFSPRHRHNFDQFRYQIEGQNDFGRNGAMTAGMLGYFPEAAYYGPQISGANSVTVVLQFGGASGQGYMSSAQKEHGVIELRKVGVFEKGVFRRNDGVPGKKNMDGYQAAWEFINERPMVYGKPRYRDPLLMNAAQFDWMPVAGQRGVYDKAMCQFTERRTHALFLKLDPGASTAVDGRKIYFVTEGTGSAAERPYGRHATLYLDNDEKAVITARTTTEILVIGLPYFAAAQRSAIAAE